jgi:itaconyl-CoA hydratase
MSAAPQGFRHVGVRRFRENVGFGYHDFEVGTVIEHRPGRTVTETDNVLMTALTGNPAPIHLDTRFAENTEWGRPLVCSLVTLSIVGAMTVRATSGLTVGNLGWSDIALTAPVFVGDTLYAETEITGKRISGSRPHQGIVTCRTTGYKATADAVRGVEVLHYTRSFLVPVDPAALRGTTGY